MSVPIRLWSGSDQRNSISITIVECHVISRPLRHRRSARATFSPDEYLVTQNACTYDPGRQNARLTCAGQIRHSRHEKPSRHGKNLRGVKAQAKGRRSSRGSPQSPYATLVPEKRIQRRGRTFPAWKFLQACVRTLFIVARRLRSLSRKDLRQKP